MPKVEFYSFGKKHLQSYQFDMVIDTRVIKNPYYQEELRKLNGLDDRVYDFVMAQGKPFLDLLCQMLDTYLPTITAKYGEIKIGIMCTGGKHRSVSIARFLYARYQSLFDCQVTHLDVYHEIS